MIASVNALMGADGGSGGECTEAIVMQRRPRWIMLAVFVVGSLAVLFANLVDIGSSIARGAVIGGAVGTCFAVFVDYFVIAAGGDQVVLAKSSKMSAKAKAVDSRMNRPVSAEIDKGLLNLKVTIDGERYQVARQFQTRLESILN